MIGLDVAFFKFGVVASRLHQNLFHIQASHPSELCIDLPAFKDCWIEYKNYIHSGWAKMKRVDLGV